LPDSAAAPTRQRNQGKATPAAEVSRAGPLQRIGNWQFRIPVDTDFTTELANIDFPGRLRTHLG
jgi:hypothetical protein